MADKQATTARVLDVVPLDENNSSWLLGMEMEQAGNFWGIKYAPADWAEEEAGRGTVPEPVTPPRSALKPAETVRAVQNVQAKAAAPAANPARSPLPWKEIPEAVMQRLLSECRLAAISGGACYVQTGRTFPTHAPVRVNVRAAGKEHSFHGSVRVEHVGAGMGIEFTNSGQEHDRGIAALIDSLSAQGDKLPEVKVQLAPPEKSAQPKSKASGSDSLLGLILVGGSLKRNDFLHELDKQRRHG